jgi:methyl-accepting chemotaxis protein
MHVSAPSVSSPGETGAPARRAVLRPWATLGGKVASGIVAILTVAMGAATWTSVTALHRASLRRAQAEAEAYGRPLVLRAQELYALNPEPSMLRVLTVELQKVKQASPSLLFFAVVDPQSAVLAHSDASQLGRQLPPRPRQALAGDATVTLDTGEALETFLPITHQGQRVATLMVGQSSADARRQRKATVIRFVVLGSLLALGSALAAIILLRRWLLEPVGSLSAAAQAVAAGRLDQSLHPHGRDELGRLEWAFAKMVEGLRGLVTAVRGGADQVASASTDIAGTAAQTAAGAEATAAAVEQMTATMHEVNANIGAVTGHTGSAAASVGQTSAAIAQLAASIERVADEAALQAEAAARAHASLDVQEEASTKLRQGLETTTRAAEELGVAIRALGSQAQDIDAIVEVIDDLAEQTNLLALNAAIEAARAGEHGAGFAVVAEEVRRLAERSAASAKEIGGLVRGIQGGADAAAEKMHATSDTITQALTHSSRAREARGPVREAVGSVLMKAQHIQAATAEQRQGSREIAAAAARLTELMAGIRTATEEQSAGAGQVVTALEKIREVAAGNAAAAAELSASVTQLSSQTGHLQGMVARFETGNGHGAPTAAGAGIALLPAAHTQPPGAPHGLPARAPSTEERDLRRSLRWSLAALLNVIQGVEMSVGVEPVLFQTRAGVRTGVRHLGVPGNAVRKLADVETTLKSWDAKAFQAAQDFRQVAAGPSERTFEYPHCPAVLATVRQVAERHLARVPVGPYSRSLGMPLGDFLCVLCHFCRAELVDRLTDGAFCVRDVENHLQDLVPGLGVCRFRVEPRR